MCLATKNELRAKGSVSSTYASTLFDMMTEHHHLSESERAQIVCLKTTGMSNRQIGAELDFPPSTVDYTLKRLREHGTLEDLPRSGRPRKLEVQDLRDVPQLL